VQDLCFLFAVVFGSTEGQHRAVVCTEILIRLAVILLPELWGTMLLGSIVQKLYNFFGATLHLSMIEDILRKRPLIIAGPCSAETEEQLLQTAHQLKAIQKVDVLRAGIWKPRTRPGNFEGVGVQGLPWLLRAHQETGLPTAVEVATARQAEEALRFGVHILWIGARTTVNPFSLQEVANALRGVDIPVLIKNPLNPDLELWIGAVERMAQVVGISKIGLVHRGFSVYGHSEFRNPPMWHLAIEMKRRYPELLLLNDPSHICGRRDLLQEIAQKAIDLDYDGLMIEAHRDPAQAWSDAAQQITPQQLTQMLEAIIWRSEKITSEAVHATLETIRRQINGLDDELLHIMAQRMSLVRQIGQYKKDNNITILQPNRWNEILQRTCQKGEQLGLSPTFTTQYFDAIHMESINQQNKIMND
jgi:chorismate mutase